MILRIIEPGLSPELTGDLDGVDAGRLPPGSLVAGAMDRAMMRAAERHGEFIAGFAAERPRLQVAQMMRIGLFAAADEAWLFGDRAKVLAVAIAPRCGNDEHALVDAVGLIEVVVSLRHLMDANRSTRVVGAASSAAPTVADVASSDSLCSKASSTSLASAAASLFLAASASRAQIAALSADVMLPTAVNSFSRKAADCSGSRVSAARHACRCDAVHCRAFAGAPEAVRAPA